MGRRKERYEFAFLSFFSLSLSPLHSLNRTLERRENPFFYFSHTYVDLSVQEDEGCSWGNGSLARINTETDSGSPLGAGRFLL